MGAGMKPRKRRAVGGVLVYCRGCGRRGMANVAIVGKQRSLEQCAECRPDRPERRR
jgi:hypothetical protein